jgi:hypothetical protein
MKKIGLMMVAVFLSLSVAAMAANQPKTERPASKSKTEEPKMQKVQPAKALADQIAKALPGEMIPQLEIYGGRLTDAVDIQTSAENLARFFASCVQEMKHAALVVGRTSVHELCREDLCCVDSDLAEALGVAWAGKQTF